MAPMLLPITPIAQEPEKVAFRIAETSETVTFDQLERRSNQAAHLLRSCGVQSGDHIILLAENCRQFLEICFAADRAGIYYTAISTHATADEAAYITAHCGAKLVIITRSQICDRSPSAQSTHQHRSLVHDRRREPWLSKLGHRNRRTTRDPYCR